MLKTCKPGQQEKTRCKTSGWYPFSTATGTIAIRHDQSHGWKILPPPKAIRIDLPLKFTATCALPLRLAGISALRWMDNPQQLNTLRTTSIVPVDLNSLMFKMEKILARASKAAGDNAMANQYETLANARQKGIEKYLWNDQQGWYADYDLKSHKVAQSVNRCRLFPLYVNAAAKESRQQNGNQRRKHICCNPAA